MAAGDGLVTLTWTATTGATSYNIYRDDGVGLYLYEQGITATSYVDESAINGVSYNYAVTSANGSGESTPAGSSTPVTPQLAAPGLDPHVISSTQIDIDWTNPSASHLELEVQGPGDLGFGTSGTFSFGAMPHTSYSFRLRADRDGVAVYASDSATTPFPAPSASNATLEKPTISIDQITDYDARVIIEGDYGDPGYIAQMYASIARTDDPYGVLDAYGSSGNHVDWYPGGESYPGHYVGRVTFSTPGSSYLVSFSVSTIFGDFSPPSDPQVVSATGSSEVPAVHLFSKLDSGGDMLVTWAGGDIPGQHVAVHRIDPDGTLTSCAGGTTGDGWLLAPAGPTGSKFFGFNFKWVNGRTHWGTYSNFADASGASDGNAPAAPANLSATAQPTNKIALLWDNITPNEDGYIIQRSTDGVNFSNISVVSADRSTYVDIVPDVTIGYSYQVVATRGGLQSNASNKAASNKSYTTDELAGIIYNETGLLRPQWKDGAKTHTVQDYDPASVAKLAAGRKAIGNVAINRARAGNRGGVASTSAPTADELQNPDVLREWNLCKSAAQGALDDANNGLDSTGGAKNYYLRQGPPPPADPNSPDWWKTKAADLSFGPFRKLSNAGDVPPGDDAWIDIYRGIR